MAKSNFIVRGGGDFSGLYKEFNKAQQKMSSFQSGINKAMAGIKFAIGTLAIGKGIKDSTKAAMTVESSILQIQRTMQGNAATFNVWAKTQSKGFGMAREEAYKYGATYSNLINTFTSGAAETEKYTTDLLKASAVVASATGRTIEDTMERIRSGLLGNTESIEDLGINVNVAMLESTKAFKQFANGRSWQQLTFQEQQQIRLMAILEQANTKYGNSLAGTTQTKQQMFLATLKNIRLNLGQAFLPIYNIALPALTSLASKLESITASLAAFTQALFGKSSQVQTKQTQSQSAAVTDLGDATEEAGKKAKGALAGFDEINKLGKVDDGSGAVAGGLEGIENPLVAQSDDGTGGAMGQMATKAAEAAEKIRTAFTNMKNIIVENKNIILPAIGAIVGALVGLAAYNGISGLAASFKVLMTTVKLAWATLLAHPMIAVAAAIGALVGAFITAYKTNDEFRASIDKIWEKIKTALTPVIQTLGDVLTWLWQSVILPVAAVLIDVLKTAFDGISYSVKWLWEYVLEPLGKFILSVLSPIFEALAKLLINILKFSVEAVIKTFEFLWYNVLKPITTWLSSTFKPVFEFIGKSIKSIIEGLQLSFDGLITFITGVFTANWRKAWEGIRTIFKGTFGTLWEIAKTPLNLIIDAVNRIIDGLNSLSIDVPSWVPGFGGKTWGVDIPNIPRLATGAITDVNNPFMAVVGDNRTQREVISPLDDLLGMITTAVNSAVGNVGGGDIYLNVKFGEDTILDKVVSGINRQSRINGKTVVDV
jgi:hypothetical protein